MGLAHRVIPTLLSRHGSLVKGKQFSASRIVGVTEQAVRIQQRRGVDEIVLLDVAATPDGRGPDLPMIEKLSEFVFSPLTVGGGVRSPGDLQALLRAGADKVAIGTGVFEVPDLLQECSDAVGRQAIVVAIDVLGGSAVMTRCGKLRHNHDPVYTADWAERYGAGEILLTSIDREGTMQGYDLDLIRSVSEAVSIPVIAHGGCSGYEDMLNAIKAGAHAVAAGALFQFTDATPKGASRYLQEHGVEARV